MTTSLPISTAIVLTEAPRVEERMGRILALLASEGISVVVTDQLDEANKQLSRCEVGEVQCVLLDADTISDSDGIAAYLDDIRSTAGDADLKPIVVASAPSQAVVLAAFRAGAGDVIDLTLESDAHILAVLQRIAVDRHRRVQRRRRVRCLRTILEDLVKDLIQTERRSIDLEHLIAARDSVELFEVFHPNRQACVLVVDDERDTASMLVEVLAGVELDTHACFSGEDAVAFTKDMAKRGRAIDLALTDICLPGITGLETIEQMRLVKPDLAAILMSGLSDSKTADETAMCATEHGVVDYVVKPFRDTHELVERVKKHAIESMNYARGRHYVEQIKERHGKSLLRYRKIAADLDQLYL
ncbi:MAG: response regulator [Proteobacteria bacterium]|nr:response regulator [Pseudomonadota bacterium]